MKRPVLLPLILLMPGALLAQTSPSAVVYSQPSEADIYIAAHPGATLFKAQQGQLIFQNADHSFTLRSGSRVAYQQNGVWLPSKLQVAALNDGSGWTLTGVPISASLVGPTAIVKDLSLSSGSVTMNFHLPQLTYNGDDTFNFQENGTAWLLRVSEGAVTISAKVAKRAGSAAHSLGYNSFESAVTIDAKGGLHVGGQVHVSRPVMVGADGKSFAACSQWSSNGSAVSFTCDDTKLPDAAFPYIIDPDFTTGPSGYDWPYLEDDEEDCCYSGQNWDDNYWNETFDVSSIPANSITGVNVTGPGSSWYPLLGYGATPSCQSNGSSWSIANGVLTYTMDFQMGWYADGSWYACEGTIYNPGSATADITYVAPETYVVPTMTGPLSANTGIPMTINIPGGQQYSSWGKPEYFVFYYGDGTSSGYVYTSTTHTYSAPGTYQMTFNVYTTNGPYVPAANAWTVTVTTLPVSITLATSPPGLTITADGTGYTSPHVFSWTPGSQHTIAVSSPQGSSGTQYVFSSWTDAGAASHSITVPTSAATYTANFVTQYYLTATPGAGGSITPASGWQNAGNVTITAVPAPGYALSAFGGALSGTTNPQMLNLTGPATVTASFLAVPTSNITFTTDNQVDPSYPPWVSVDGAQVVCPCSYQWLPGSWHSVSAGTSTGGPGIQYTFYDWSDGGAATHSFEVPAGGILPLNVHFQTRYLLTTSVSPAGSGAIMVGTRVWTTVISTGTAAQGWYNAGAAPWVIAQAGGGYQFHSLDSDPDKQWVQIAMNGPVTVTAMFDWFTGQTVTSNPPGASLKVDGAGCTTPCPYQWSTGTQHTLSVTSPQVLASGIQLTFASWPDGSSGASDTITAAAGAIYTANFSAQYYLTTTAVPAAAGSISPGSGWYDSGQVVQVSAAANAGAQFSGFSGGLSGTTNPQNVTMNGPVSVTANFAGVFITTASLPAGVTGIAYSTTLSATGGTGVYTWSIALGSLPAGLQLSTSGTISGTPGAVGSSSFTVRVVDSGATSATAQLTLAVNPTGLAITGQLSAAVVGQAYSATLTARGGTGSYTWRQTGLPAGLGFSSGAISGVVSSAGSYPILATVTDSSGKSASQSFTITAVTQGRIGAARVAVASGPGCADPSLGVPNDGSTWSVPACTGVYGGTGFQCGPALLDTPEQAMIESVSVSGPILVVGFSAPSRCVDISSPIYESTFDVQVRAPGAAPGYYDLSMLLQDPVTETQLTVTDPGAVSVYDTTPVATSVSPPAVYAGQQGVPVTIYGSNFGESGTVQICAGLGGGCGATLTDGTSVTQTGWGDNSIGVSLDVPVAGTYCFEVGVDNDASGEQFQGSSNESAMNSGACVTAEAVVVTITGPAGIAAGGSDQFSIMTSPPGNGQLTLTLSTTSGTGSANFGADGSSTIVPASSTPTWITVYGGTASSTANNITISASYAGQSVTSEAFSVVSVSISLNTTGSGSAGDSAWEAFSQGVTAFGSVISSFPGQGQVCATAVELVGSVNPADYSGPITLRRTKNMNAYKGTQQIDQESNDDTSEQASLDTNPQSSAQGATPGAVYDLDAPGISAPTSVSDSPGSPDYFTHYRSNFVEYAILGSYNAAMGEKDSTSPRNASASSNNFQWSGAASCTFDPNNPDTTWISHIFDAAGDNRAGQGTIKTSWNLQ